MTSSSRARLKWRRIALLLLANSFASLGAEAQSPQQVVQWHATVSSPSPLKAGQTATVEVTGEILEGWHVYGLKQKPGGPTQLKADIEANPIAQPAGSATGTVPEKLQDPRFGVETQYYTHSFKVRLPLKLSPRAASGKQDLPVSVRFQSCSESVCLPPTTIHLTAQVEVQPNA